MRVRYPVCFGVSRHCASAFALVVTNKVSEVFGAINRVQEEDKLPVLDNIWVRDCKRSPSLYRVLGLDAAHLTTQRLGVCVVLYHFWKVTDIRGRSLMTGERQLFCFQEEQDRQHKNYRTISYKACEKKTASHQPFLGTWSRRPLGVARVDLGNFFSIWSDKAHSFRGWVQRWFLLQERAALDYLCRLLPTWMILRHLLTGYVKHSNTN